MAKKIRRNNPANVIADVAKKEGVAYHSILRKHNLIVRMHNPTLDKHEAYMKRCEARRMGHG